MYRVSFCLDYWRREIWTSSHAYVNHEVVTSKAPSNLESYVCFRRLPPIQREPRCSAHFAKNRQMNSAWHPIGTRLIIPPSLVRLWAERRGSGRVISIGRHGHIPTISLPNVDELGGLPHGPRSHAGGSGRVLRPLVQPRFDSEYGQHRHISSEEWPNYLQPGLEYHAHQQLQHCK